MHRAQGAQFVTRHPGAELWWLDDDIQLCQIIAPQLIACGWKARVFHTPELLETVLQHSRPDLLLLDQRLKTAVGLDILRNLRAKGEAFPILILSALAAPADRIAGLEQGAQDYIGKPFHLRELQLRCEQLLQRERRSPITAFPAETQVSLGSIRFSPHQGVLEKPGEPPITLTRGERALLLALCRARGRVLSREDLALATGSLASTAGSRSIDVRLSRLRRLLAQLSGGAIRIETIRTQGYALQIGANDQRPEDWCD